MRYALTETQTRTNPGRTTFMWRFCQEMRDAAELHSLNTWNQLHFCDGYLLFSGGGHNASFSQI
jgi:hypothetical protein